MRVSKQIPITQEYLMHHYVHKKQSAPTIAKHLGCSTDTIYRKLKEFAIPRRSLACTLPQNEVVKLYRSKEYSIQELAKHFHISKTTLYHYLKKWNILPQRKLKAIHLPQELIQAYVSGTSATELSKLYHVAPCTIIRYLQVHHIPIRYSKKRHHLNKEEISYLYTISKLSTTEIASIYAVKPSTIASRLREFGIPLRGNDYHLSLPTVLSRYQEGQSIQQIASSLGVNYHIVRNLLIKHKHYVKAPRYKKYATDVRNLYFEQGLSCREIANQYGCHPETIRRLLRQN